MSKKTRKNGYHSEYFADTRRDKDVDIAERPIREWGKPAWLQDNDPDMPPADYAFPAKVDWKPTLRSEWTTGDVPAQMEATECSFDCKDKTKPLHTIQLNERVTTAIQWLMENKNVEWQMLLRGVVHTFPGEGDVVDVTDYYIPKQRVGPATVHNEDCIDAQLIRELGIVATIHSHVSMGAFFSGTDMTECNTSPIKYHVVMNNKYEYQSVKQIKLPCGMLRFNKCEVVLYSPQAVQPTGIENIVGGSRYYGTNME